ncbi:MAG: hypothetical protein RL425_372 [Pseudomonadota bacterium]
MSIMKTILAAVILSGLTTLCGPSQAAQARQTRFTLCAQGGGENCVVDGDTIWLQGEKIRIADIDTPETHPARCAQEAALGEKATLRLRDLLNQGRFSVQPIKRDRDRYGRKLRILERDGQSLGLVLVREGLARPYQGGRRAPWCV